MDEVSVTLKVFFEEPFWVGVLEHILDNNLSVCKITFKKEPKDYEIYEFLLRNYTRLRFSPTVQAVRKDIYKNPKKAQKEIQKQVKPTGIGTKAQMALKLQQEQKKFERKIYQSRKKREQKQEQFEQRQQKKKEKHRGR